MSVIKHRVEFESDFIEGGYTARCSCGWSSDLYETMAEANELADFHADDDVVETESET